MKFSEWRKIPKFNTQIKILYPNLSQELVLYVQNTKISNGISIGKFNVLQAP